MGKDLVKITNFEQYNSLFIQLFKDKEKFLQVQNLIAAECQRLEDAIFEIINEFNIDNGEGVTLDIIGQWVDLPREGRSDTDYKKVLKVKVIINSGSGEHETIVTALTGIYNVTKAQLMYLGNANLQIWVDIALTTSDYDEIVEILCAGVGLTLVGGSSNPFVFFGDPDGLGFNYLVTTPVPLEVDIGSGLDDFDIDYGSGADIMEVLFTSNPTPTTEGGEYQSLLGQTD